MALANEKKHTRKDMLGAMASSNDSWEMSSSCKDERFDVNRYYNDPSYRIYDSFDMLDFYSRKKNCIEMGKPLTKDDKKWYKDQKFR